jgi:sialic acid synthase SpsE
LGYDTTASVFDEESRDFLLEYDVPFVKIANRSHLYGVIDECPVRMYVSVSSPAVVFDNPLVLTLENVAKYPAGLDEYERVFPDLARVSDHTVGWELYRKHKPEIIEKHFVHERRATNPDAGPFAVTPGELAEVL